MWKTWIQLLWNCSMFHSIPLRKHTFTFYIYILLSYVFKTKKSTCLLDSKLVRSAISSLTLWPTEHIGLSYRLCIVTYRILIVTYSYHTHNICDLTHDLQIKLFHPTWTGRVSHITPCVITLSTSQESTLISINM